MRGILFDLDGTLLDSMPMWHELDSRFLRLHGVEPPPDVTESVKNMTAADAAAYYAERFPLSMTPEEIMTECEALAAEAYRRDLQLKPGAEAFLHALAEREIPFGLVSVTYRRLLEAALDRLRIRPLFRFLLTPEDGLPGKHLPDLYLRGAELLNAAPAACMVVEDALYAAKTAKQAGFYTLGFYDGAAAAEWDEIRAVCDRTAAHWTELCVPAFFAQFQDGK